MKEEKCCGSGKALPSTPSVERCVPPNSWDQPLTPGENAAGLQIIGRKGTLLDFGVFHFKAGKFIKQLLAFF